MKQNTDHEELMVNYLLGALPEAEQLRLEEQFFTDDEYYQQLLALEDELRYDYVAGGLTPGQRAKFERRFLNSPPARQKADLARAVLDKMAETRPASLRAPVREERKSLWQSLLAFFSFQNSALQFSLAAAAVLLLAGATWLFYQTVGLRSQVKQLETARINQERQERGQAQQAAELRARQQQLTGELERERRERAQLEQDLARQKAASERPSSSSGSFLSFILAPGLVRDTDGLKRLPLPLGVNRVRLQLTLKRPANYQSYRAVLQTLDGVALWSQNLSYAKPMAAGQAVAVNLPAKLMPPGDYILALKGQTAGGMGEEIDEYYFSIARP